MKVIVADASIRIGSRRGYTTIPNGLLPTGQLSARAWGVYVYLLSRPPGWECRVYHLQNVFTEGRDAIYAALRELVASGLMVKETVKPAGKPPVQRFALPDEPDTEKPDTAQPDTGKPHPENPYGNSQERDSATTEEATTDRGSDLAVASESIAEHFDVFWQGYPRKVGKPQALAAFKKAVKRESVGVILIAVGLLAADPNLPEKRFIPHAATWLNRDGWNDEPYPPRQQQSKPTRGQENLAFLAELAQREQRGIGS